MADDEPRPDRFEIALTLALEEACREDDFDAILEALVEIWDAVEEAGGLNQAN